ncbi:MAG: biotin transporter BioY [Candidatus Zixiibacteriota bacterium]
MTAHQLTIYDAIRPSARWMEIVVLAAFNVLLVACSYIAVPLPFSPVPVTGQTFGVMVIAMTLGRIRGTAVVLAYLLEGALGLPVLAGGNAGLPVFFGATGGYLFGFVGAAYVMGWLADNGWHRTLFRSLSAMLIGQVVIYTCGLAWLSGFMPSGQLLVAGLFPFLPGAAAKIALAGGVIPSVWRIVKRTQSDA